MFKSRYKYISTALNNKPGMSSVPADLDGLRRLIALQQQQPQQQQ
jgi:hypothetical protein